MKFRILKHNPSRPPPDRSGQEQKILKEDNVLSSPINRDVPLDKKVPNPPRRIKTCLCQQAINNYSSTFLSVRKVAKEARTSKIIARIFLHCAKTKEPAYRTGRLARRLAQTAFAFIRSIPQNSLTLLF
ncbi:MAG TPA: hypothetical protein DHV28_11840 [Ignavibacteriales bacterium]|nr:hypothetical protein [Ignavibacteriales bacterium]